jgi:hypothetical protein
MSLLGLFLVWLARMALRRVSHMRNRAQKHSNPVIKDTIGMLCLVSPGMAVMVLVDICSRYALRLSFSSSSQ